MHTFMAEYAKQLAKAASEFPDEYRWPAGTTVELVVQRMAEAVRTKTYNKDSRAFRETCKALKIKHTYTAINHFVANHV